MSCELRFELDRKPRAARVSDPGSARVSDPAETAGRRSPSRLWAIFFVLLIAVPEVGEPAGAAEPAAPQVPAPAVHPQSLESMSAAEKKELQSKQERFYRLDEKEQDRLRRLHEELWQDPEAARLEKVLQRYASWLQTLPSGQRADLLSLPPSDRVAEIKRLLQEQSASRMRSYVSRKLSDGDLRTIAGWMEDIVKRREPEILERWPMLQEHLAQIPDPKRRMQALVIMAQRIGPGSRRDWLKPTAEDIERLKSRLSPEAQEDLEKAKSEGRLSELAEAWMRAAMFSRFTGPPVDREQLRRFYADDLDPDQRAYLESLPPERMQSELQRMYHAHRFRRDGIREWPGGRKLGPGLRPFPPRFGPANREPGGDLRPPGPGGVP